VSKVLRVVTKCVWDIVINPARPPASTFQRAAESPGLLPATKPTCCLSVQTGKEKPKKNLLFNYLKMGKLEKSSWKGSERPGK